MTPFEQAFDDVAKLVRKFEEHKEQFTSAKYKEAEVRADFLDDFWIALGWDVRHKDQTNPREQEVKIEKSDSVSFRKADYAFHLKPEYHRPVFLVEAKKPSEDLSRPEFYFQTARYGFNTATSVAVLTDFQEFHIIDCRRKPELVKGIVEATRLYKFTYKDYLDRDKFGEIYWKFSREAVAAGKLKEYWRSLKKPKGATKQLKLIGDQLQAPDELFLDDLEEYRRTLASEFKKANPELTSEDLTEAAQKVLDRLVFIRFLEDKTIEPDFILDKFTSGSKTSAWKSFVLASQRLDRDYNGVVFKEHFIDRPGFKPPKEERFEAICEEMSHQRSPYLFSYIPVEILGSIYERFLGKVVVAKGRGISIEEKPEVRKAGGVYYTPKYIVDYIVENTVGTILESKDPHEVGKLRFADIACGSGSFLVAMFERIVRHLEDWYNEHPKTAKEANCRKNDTGRWMLSLDLKRRVLRENIYGVDIDPQAVEVAQFSLFLKLLEFENIATKQETLEFDKKHTILPDLSKNIVCGNSLVDFGLVVSREEEMRIRPMNFDREFKGVMEAGGFDAVVGNPPYGARLNEVEHAYLRTNYETAATSLDSYVLFIERGAELLNNRGLLGLIVQSGWVSAPSGKSLRNFFAKNLSPVLFVTLPYDIFGAYIDTIVLVAQRKSDKEKWSDKVRLVKFPVRYSITSLDEFDRHELTGDPGDWLVSRDKEFLIALSKEEQSIIRKVSVKSSKLETVTDIQRGVTPFKLTESPPRVHPSAAFSGTVRRYTLTEEKQMYIRYDQTLAEYKPPRYFEGPRVLLREMISRQFRLQAAYTDKSFVTNKSMQSILVTDPKYDHRFILGLINSKLISWYFLAVNSVGRRDDFPKIVLKQTRELPLPLLDFLNKETKRSHDELSSLVNQMLVTKEQLEAAQRESEREQLQRKCDYIDGEIDKLVYALYGLTEEEIRIVEGNV